MLDADVVDAFCRELFPARAELASLEYVSASIAVPSWGARGDKAPMVLLTVRLVTWSERNGKLEIQDIKEQEISFAAASEAWPRVQAYLAAFVDVLARALAAPLATIETLMPHDFVHTDVLALKTAQSKEDFVAAFERPSRLGALLARLPSSSSPSSEPDPDSSL